MSDNRTTELLPCPFCGGEAHIAENVGYRGDISYTVNCNDVYGCIASDSGFWYSSLEAAIEAWNTRHIETCENTHENRWFRCSTCGFGFTDMHAEDESDINEQPRHCPNCGAKVVDA